MPYRLEAKPIAGSPGGDFLVYEISKMDLTVDNFILVPTQGFTMASVSWNGQTAWSTGVVTVVVSNNGGITLDAHPSGYVIGGVTTTQGTFDAVPLEHGWFGLRCSTGQTSTLADFWICLKRRPV